MDKKCDNLQKDFKTRLNKIKGQVNGIERMIGDKRDVAEITQQITAIKAALTNLGVELLKSETENCLKNKNKDGKSKAFEKLVESFFRLN